VAFRTGWARSYRGRLSAARALALTAALAAALPVAACTSGHASSAASARRAASPAITAPQARQVWEHFVAVSGAEASKAGNPALALSLETGPRRAVDSASLKALNSGLRTGKAYRGATVGQVLGLPVPPAYDAPAFFLPKQSGYPHFFVAAVTSKLTSNSSSSAAGPASADGAEISSRGPALMLFEQSSADAPWLLASTSSLAVGETVPKLATDGAGFVPAVPLSDAALVAPPASTGPLQAAMVDDGPASAAGRAVAAGPLTTGLYQGARSHADGLTAPRGDVYQWQLDGANYPEFALRTADGGALVFYAMNLNTTVAVPDVINKGNPIHAGPPIQVPDDLRQLLPPGGPAPRVQLQSQQVLSFAAVDPPAGQAKIRVITMGGGLTGASAS
jgi:hypothetical protein